MDARVLLGFAWCIFVILAGAPLPAISAPASDAFIGDVAAQTTLADPQSASLTREYIVELIVGGFLLVIFGQFIWAQSLRRRVTTKAEKLQKELLDKQSIKDELQHQHNLLAEISSLADVGGWKFDSVTSKLSWNPMIYKIYEVPDDFVPNVKAATSFFAPEVRDQVLAEFRQGVADGSGWDIELPVITAKGNRKWVRSRGKCEMVDGKVVAIYGAVQDITRRKQGEKEIQRQRDLLDQVGALATIGGWEIDLRTNAHRWSKTTYKIHELSNDFDPSVARAIELYAPEARDTIRDTYNHAIESGEGWDIELPLLTVKGNRKWVRSHAQCEVENGKVVRIYGLTQDITRYHEVENELKQHKEELSSRLAEVEYSRQQVEKQAEELVTLAEQQNTLRTKAEIGERSKAEFLAIMSHEIRTPMTGIIGMTDLLLLDNLTPEQEKRARTIKNSSELLLTILNDILDQSKLDSGKFELSNVDIRLPELVEETVDLLREKAESKGLEIEFAPPATLPAAINIDAFRLQQVIINLISNAIKFTDDGVIALNIEPDRTPQGDDLLRFEVTDNGIGISEEQKSRLFMRFEQADPSTARKYGGSGLGLSICKQLIELMGGDIGVDSDLGKGSRFWFTVPLRPVDLGEETVDTETDTEIESRPLHILLAEDNPVNQTLVSTLLEHAGHKVDIVGNGQMAVDAVAEGDFDMVLMDVRMPVMEGPEATKHIRESGHEKSQIPIVALTADAMKEYMPRYLEAGMNAVETKPIQLENLLRTIDTVMAEASDEAAGSPAEAAPDVAAPRGDIGDAGKMAELGKLLDAAAMAGLVEDAARSLSGNIVLMRKGLTSQNGDDVQSHAHTIRGMCGSMGALRLAQEAAYIEENIDDLDRIEEFLPTFEATAEETVTWWTQFVPGKQRKIA